MGTSWNLWGTWWEHFENTKIQNNQNYFQPYQKILGLSKKWKPGIKNSSILQKEKL
jgi:hypothetical protein